MSDCDSPEIRRYEPGEEEAIWEVVYQATHESNARDYHPDLIDRWAPHDQDLVKWAERVGSTNPFVALLEGEIVGMAEVNADGFIDYFYVHPNFQSRGVGKALLSCLIAESKPRGVDKLFAYVSITAQPFFSSQGFRITESHSNVIQGHPAPNFSMERRLDGSDA